LYLIFANKNGTMTNHKERYAEEIYSPMLDEHQKNSIVLKYNWPHTSEAALQVGPPI
jgi:hypothetical protein